MMIRIITAMTWLISLRSRPIISSWPSPRLRKIISAWISERHANAHPCFIPFTINGKLAGNSTDQKSRKPLAAVYHRDGHREERAHQHDKQDGFFRQSKPQDGQRDPADARQ